MPRLFSMVFLIFVFLRGADARAQVVQASASNAPPLPAAVQTGDADVKQVAQLLHLDDMVSRTNAMRTARACGSTATMEELTIREDLMEALQAASLDTDSVLSELSNEQSEINELRAELQSRRDKGVARLNTAALLTGSGLGAIVSATQFTTLGSRTQNTGDALGVGAGATSTILSLLASKRQSGPSGTVGKTPNMLSPLLGGTPVLATSYPPAVLRYLQAPPMAGTDAGQSRIEQLQAEWVRSGRISARAGQSSNAPAALTSSNDPSVKVSISDLSSRIAMLGDVRGRVSLMKRDLAALRRMSLGNSEECGQ